MVLNQDFEVEPAWETDQKQGIKAGSKCKSSRIASETV
jgi:hypothetical protein